MRLNLYVASQLVYKHDHCACGQMAQWLGHWICNRKVAGSSLTGAAWPPWSAVIDNSLAHCRIAVSLGRHESVEVDTVGK